jgi:hypothetical protein
MGLQRCSRGLPQRDGPYADGKNTGSAIFCANTAGRRGYIAALSQRDPSGLLVVVIGASHARSLVTATDWSAASRWSNETGS